MNKINRRKLILSNLLISLTSFTFFIWMITTGVDVVTVYGATKPIPFTFDTGVFNITDLSIKEGDYSTDIIGFIENVDPFFNTIKGVSLKIEMYDRNNHLIDVAESGYSSLPSEFRPEGKYAFKIPIDKNNELDHLHIQILAQDWGTSYIPSSPSENVSAAGNYTTTRPYLGIVGVALTPDMSKQLGLNQTKGFLLTSITEGSPAEKADLRAGTTTKTFNGREINVGGDIILKIDNKEVSRIIDIISSVSQKRIGDNITLTILRDNGTREVDLTLAEIPSQDPAVFAGENDSVENLYFSINIPDNWTYVEGSNTPESRTTGYGIINTIKLTPNEFSEILLADENNEKIADGGLIAYFFQDLDYRIKNAPLESYVKYQINNFGIQNITSQQYTTVGNEKSVRIDANESAWYGGAKIVLYLVMHDKVPYTISYAANEKNYEKYLPEFEKMVKSFRFVDSPSSEIDNLSGNASETNTRTNFSGASENLTDLYGDIKDGNYPEELYDECVSVAGKSFCDFLFKK